MLSCGKGVLSAVAKAEILSPEIAKVARDQVLCFTEIRNITFVKGKNVDGAPGSKVIAGRIRVASELGRATAFSKRGNRVEAEKVTKRDGWVAVGSVHSSLHNMQNEGTDTRTMRMRKNYAEH